MQGGTIYMDGFHSPGRRSHVYVFVLPLPVDWKTTGYSLDDAVAHYLETMGEMAGFTLVDYIVLTQTVGWTVARFDVTPQYCGGGLHTRHIMAPVEVFHLAVEVCSDSFKTYDKDFVHTVFEGFAIK